MPRGSPQGKLLAHRKDAQTVIVREWSLTCLCYDEKLVKPL